METDFEPPSHLSAESKELWRDLVPRRARSAGRLVLLRSALESLDRAEQARAAISELTTTTKKSGVSHINPLLKCEREFRQQYARIWSDLHLGYDQAEDGTDFERWKAKQVQAAMDRSDD